MSSFSFDSDVAIEVGANAAVLYHNIKFWCDKNRANDAHCYDGQYWTYNSHEAFAELFPFMNQRQVKHALKKLIDAGYLLVANHNKNKQIRVNWYADNRNFEQDIIISDKDKNVSDTDNNVLCHITDINTDIKPDINITPKSPNQENQLSIAKPNSELTANSENEIAKSSESQVSAAVKLYFDLANKHNLPKIQKTTAEIQQRIKACIKALEADSSSWYEFLQIIDRSPHLIGQSRANWRCNLKWVIKPSNFEKIRDGNYLERTPANQTENVFEIMGNIALEGAYDE